MPRLTAAVLLTVLGMSILGVSKGMAASGPPPDRVPGVPPRPPSATDALPDSALPQPFGLAGVEVSAERERPQACFAFNRPLPRPTRRGPDPKRFVTVDPPVEGLSFLMRDNELCLEGLAHGGSYAVTVSADLPARDGVERLGEAVTRTVTVPDRRPALAFRGQGYILPRVGVEGLPLRSTNVERARLQVLRIADRALVEQIYYGRINQTLTDFDVGAILEEKGEVVWQGEIATGGDRNRTKVTPFPIEAVLGSLQPGVYIAVAENAALPQVAWDQRATQWFVVSDVGLTSFRAANGLFVFARSLLSAEPLPQVELRLVARDNTELGRAVTGLDGLARFQMEGLARTGPKAPQALFAAGPNGGFSLLDFGTPAVELSERGAGGRTVTGDLDAYLFADRALYRPGDTIHLTALLRDGAADAVTGRELLLRLQRPDGLVMEQRRSTDQGLGGHSAAFTLPPTAPEGEWTLTAMAEAGGPILGRAKISVGEVEPPRLTFSLTADRPRIASDGRAAIRIDGRTVQGGAAANTPGEARLVLRAAADPWPGLDGYRFGLIQEPFREQSRPVAGFTTSATGAARVNLSLGEVPRTSQPLEVAVTTTLHDIGGRAVERDLVLPVDHQPFAIGIRPDFAGDAVPEGASVSFDVVAVAPDGRFMVRPDLAWELYEEEFDYDWFEAEGRWDYRTTVRDRRLTGGTVDAEADGPAVIEEQVKAGRYRLEVFDPASGIASSIRFSAGWWVSARVGETPDAVEVVVEDPVQVRGGTARVFVRPPYAATVLVTVADRAVRHTLTREIGPEGAFLDIPVDTDVTAGAYVLATAYAPADPARRAPPRRAVGLGWIGVDPAPRTLDVALSAPGTARPGEDVAVPVTVRGLEPGAAAYLVVRAVDERLLRRDGAAVATDPVGWFHGRRTLPVELRDVYGRLSAPQIKVRPESAMPAPPAGRAEGTPTIAVYSGIVPVGADGTASVRLRLPDGEGRLRVEAVAWSAGKVGRADAAMQVRSPVPVLLGVPDRLLVGDDAQLSLTIENRSGPRGDYAVAFTLTGPFTLSGDDGIDFGILPRGRRITTIRSLRATDAGTGQLRARVTGPDGFTAERVVDLWAGPVQPDDYARRLLEVPPGGKALDGQKAEAPTLLTASPWPDLDTAALVLSGAEPKARSVEQIAGHLLPLLVQPEAFLPSEEVRRRRIQDLVDRLAALQRADGAFGQWGPDDAVEPWLTPFALDVLTQAKAAGYTVPEEGYRRGLDWLIRTISNSWVDQAELPARAYALYTAARARAIDAAPVRYFHETYFDRLPTRLSQAQVAAAFALLGDGDRARGVMDKVGGTRRPESRIQDHGTELRDRAGALALLAAAGAGTDRLMAEAVELAALLKPAERTSTQERAWLLAAASELSRRTGRYGLVLNGKAEQRSGLTVLRFEAGQPFPLLGNAGDRPIHVAVTAPRSDDATQSDGPGPVTDQGFSIERRLVGLDGSPVDTAMVKPGDLLVVILKGKAMAVPSGPVLVRDPLPAGFAAESVRLAGGAKFGGLSWLDGLTAPGHVEFQQDAFVAALDRDQAMGFQLAYLVRADGQGDFAWPGAVVEDLVDGSRFARTDGGRLTVRLPPTAPLPRAKPTLSAPAGAAPQDAVPMRSPAAEDPEPTR